MTKCVDQAVRVPVQCKIRDLFTFPLTKVDNGSQPDLPCSKQIGWLKNNRKGYFPEEIQVGRKRINVIQFSESQNTDIKYICSVC